MADIPQNVPGAPAGAVPPVKKETGKVQPKKETVRINLPPKPSPAPTIKLPTLPPGGPTGPPSAGPLTTSASKAAAAPAAPAAPRAATGQRTGPAGPPPIGAGDQSLIIFAAVAGLIAVGTVVWMFLILKD